MQALQEHIVFTFVLYEDLIFVQFVSEHIKQDVIWHMEEEHGEHVHYGEASPVVRVDGICAMKSTIKHAIKWLNYLVKTEAQEEICSWNL